MCDDQLWFFLFSIYFLVVQKVEFSHPVQYSTSPKYPCFPELLYSTCIVCMFWREERCPCSSSNVVAKKNVWSGRRISRRAIHNYFLFLLINGSSKESKPSEAHPRIFFLSLLLLPMTRVNPIELFFYGRFRLLLIEQKSLRQSQLTVCMKRCRRVGSSGEKVWLW